MKVIEQYTQGKKGNESLNEDCLVVAQHFIALIDGATTGLDFTLKGMNTGRFAAEVLAAEVASFPPSIEAAEAVVRATSALKKASEDTAHAEGKTFGNSLRPSGSLLVYSAARKEIWRAGDSTFSVDGQANFRSFAQEEVSSRVRSVILQARLVKGETLEALLEDDPAQDVMMKLWEEYRPFINHPCEPYGIGVINGTPIPEKYIEVFPVPRAREIVFASDGYPEVYGTLAETEASLKRVLAEDPLMYRVHPQTTGVRKGNISYDDRAYIRFTV